MMTYYLSLVALGLVVKSGISVSEPNAARRNREGSYSSKSAIQFLVFREGVLPE